MSTFRNDSYFTEADENYVFGADDVTVGAIISSICFLGFLVQLSVVYGAYRIPKLHTTFGILMFNETLGQFAACLVTFSFFFFGLICESTAIVSNSRVFGNTSLTLLPIILFSSLLMSFNRLCACSLPFKYRAVFNKRTITLYICVNWILPTAIFSYYFIFKNCNFVFFQFGWVFMEALRNEQCGSELLVLIVSAQILLITAIIIFNFITFFILVTCRRKMFRSQSVDCVKREVNFAVQVLVQGVVLILFGTWYTFGYSLLPGNSLNWKIFLSTTLSANTLHCTAPIVIFVFNAEYRKWITTILCARRAKKSVTVVTSRVEFEPN